MLSKFFIDRPVFANVIAIITVILGVVAMVCQRQCIPVARLNHRTQLDLVGRIVHFRE